MKAKYTTTVVILQQSILNFLACLIVVKENYKLKLSGEDFNNSESKSCDLFSLVNKPFTKIR